MSVDSEQRKLAAIMFTDMVGYSALSQRDDKLALELLEEHRQLLREIFPRFNGTEIKTIGDAFLIEFHSALEAAQCAIEIQRTLAKRNHDVSSDRRVEVKIGIHIGDVVHRGGDVYGDGVNIASRIEPLAGAGGICVSMDVERQIRNALEARFEKLAPIELKNISVAMDLFRIVLPWEQRAKTERTRTRTSVSGRSFPVGWIAAALLLLIVIGAWFLFGRYKVSTKQSGVAEVPVKSIAVLPFENLSRDPDNAYFADGIQDEILTRLSKIADLKVISRTSTQHYKSAPENLPEIAKQLGVAHILEGSVQKSADAVRVNVQLIKAANDSHLWADTFDRKLTDIFSVESEVAKAIADQLQAKLTGQEAQVISAKPTENPEAYDAYLRGLAYTNKPTVLATDARSYLKQAVDLDPNFAIAWALLSYVDAAGYRTLNLPHTDAIRQEARDAAERALSLQPNLGEALFAKGYYHYSCLSDYETALSYFERARRLMPNNSAIPLSLAYLSRRRGQWQQSDLYFNQAEELDPRSVIVLGQHAILFETTRRFPEALRKWDQVLNITPEERAILRFKARIAQAEGDLTTAAKLLSSQPPQSWGWSEDIATHAVQAIFDGRPAEVIPQIKEALVNPGPYLKLTEQEARFYLAWAQDLAGDHAAARQTWQEVASALETALKKEPENNLHINFLAVTYAELGDKEKAFSYAHRGMELIPIEKDPLSGPRQLELFTRVAALTGEKDQAMANMEKLLTLPYEGDGIVSRVPLTPALLRLDPMFDSLRNDPRFQKLCEDKPK
jgi:adenylate cyclase